jgi:hypothetical protein
MTTGANAEGKKNNCDTLAGISWLTGNWISKNSKRIIVENWEKVSENTYEGYSETRSMDKKNVLNFESLRLVSMSGGIFYMAKVSHNQLPIAFKLTQCSDSLAVFENPDHDFPKKIQYRLVSTDKIIVLVGSQANGFKINFKKAK